VKLLIKGSLPDLADAFTGVLRLRDYREPTHAQAQAGNYVKRKVYWKGLTITIENEAGSIRRGHKPNGDEWATRMMHPYGYINLTEGVDGDHVDVYLGPELEDAPLVYVIHQRRVDDWENYDEDKCMLGWPDEESAVDAFLSCYDDYRFLGPVTALPVEEFKVKALATKENPAMIKSLADRIGDALAGGVRLLLKTDVTPYVRGGRAVKGYHRDGSKQMDLFGAGSPRMVLPKRQEGARRSPGDLLGDYFKNSDKAKPVHVTHDKDRNVIDWTTGNRARAEGGGKFCPEDGHKVTKVSRQHFARANGDLHQAIANGEADATPGPDTYPKAKGPDQPEVSWERAPKNPKALVLLDWDDGGTTVAKLGEDGKLYGCRDVSAGPKHDGIVAAWKETSDLPVEDRRGKGADPNAGKAATEAEPAKVKKFYTTMIRDKATKGNVAWLTGPHDTHEEAQGHVEKARAAAVGMDEMHHFNAFGTAGMELPEGKHPPGKLNAHIGFEPGKEKAG
jgi:hypothetical protein